MRAFLKTIVLTVIWGLCVMNPARVVLAQGGMATDEGLEISGLLLDETKTKAGRDFFEIFSTYWREVEGLSYTITISERPDSTRGSFIIVLVNDNRIYYNRMNPRLEWIEEEAKIAVQRAGGYLFNEMITQKQLEKEFQY